MTIVTMRYVEPKAWVISADGREWFTDEVGEGDEPGSHWAIFRMRMP